MRRKALALLPLLAACVSAGPEKTKIAKCAASCSYRTKDGSLRRAWLEFPGENAGVAWGVLEKACAKKDEGGTGTQLQSRPPGAAYNEQDFQVATPQNSCRSIIR